MQNLRRLPRKASLTKVFTEIGSKFDFSMRIAYSNKAGPRLRWSRTSEHTCHKRGALLYTVHSTYALFLKIFVTSQLGTFAGKAAFLHSLANRNI